LLRTDFLLWRPLRPEIFFCMLRTGSFTTTTTTTDSADIIAIIGASALPGHTAYLVPLAPDEQCGGGV
jgi:hypothetical protein